MVGLERMSVYNGDVGLQRFNIISLVHSVASLEDRGLYCLPELDSLLVCTIRKKDS